MSKGIKIVFNIKKSLIIRKNNKEYKDWVYNY